MTELVFAYGSLIWNPGFDYIEKSPATALNCRRDLCIQSKVYRGTSEKPGAVLGLLDDWNATCDGFVYHVSREKWPEVEDYLEKREMHRDVYKRTMIEVAVNGAVIGKAHTFLANKNSVEFEENLNDEIIIERVAFSEGPAGTSFDYLSNVIQSLRSIGIVDHRLEHIHSKARELNLKK